VPETESIRALTGHDAAAWSQIRLEALDREPAAFGSSAEEHRALPHETVLSRLAHSPEKFVLGAFHGDRLIGTAGFYRDTSLKGRHKGHVWGVYVTREFRGRGIARALMNALIDRAATVPGLEQILITVASGQAAAKQLYLSLGFEPFGCEPRALKMAGLTSMKTTCCSELPAHPLECGHYFG